MMKDFIDGWMEICPDCTQDILMQHLFPQAVPTLAQHLSPQEAPTDEERVSGELSLAAFCEAHGASLPNVTKDLGAEEVRGLRDLMLRVVCDLLMRDKVICRVNNPQEEGCRNSCWFDNAFRRLVVSPHFMKFINARLEACFCVIISDGKGDPQAWRTLLDPFACAAASRNAAAPRKGIKELLSGNQVLHGCQKVDQAVSALRGCAKGMATLLTLESLGDAGRIPLSTLAAPWDETPLQVLEWSLTAREIDPPNDGEGKPRIRKDGRVNPFYLFIDSWHSYPYERYQLLCDHLIPWGAGEIKVSHRPKDRYSKFVAGEYVMDWFLRGWGLPHERTDTKANVRAVQDNIVRVMLGLVQREFITSCIPSDSSSGVYRRGNVLRELIIEGPFDEFVQLVEEKFVGYLAKCGKEAHSITNDVAFLRQEQDVNAYLEGRATRLLEKRACDSLVARVTTFSYLAGIAITGEPVVRQRSDQANDDTPPSVSPAHKESTSHDSRVSTSITLVEDDDSKESVRRFTLTCNTATGGLTVNGHSSKHDDYLQLGREEDSDILFDYKNLSRITARIRYQRGRWTIEGAASLPGECRPTNGVALRKRGGEQTELSSDTPKKLEAGDTIHAMFPLGSDRCVDDGGLKLRVQE